MLEKNNISYKRYLGLLLKVVTTSSLAAALVLALALLITGDFKMGLDGTLEAGRYDGAWFLVILPLVAGFIFLLLSPISFWLYRLISRR